MTAGELAVLHRGSALLDRFRRARRRPDAGARHACANSGGRCRDLRSETRPLLHDLRITTIEARETVDEARSDLERFDRVLGSAEAIGDAVSASTSPDRVLDADDQVRRVRQGNVEDLRPAARGVARATRSGPRTDRRGCSTSTRIADRDREPIELGEHTNATKETPSMMKRITWFVGGAAAGVAGASYATKKVKQTAAQISPTQVARSAAYRGAAQVA